MGQDPSVGSHQDKTVRTTTGLSTYDQPHQRYYQTDDKVPRDGHGASLEYKEQGQDCYDTPPTAAGKVPQKVEHPNNRVPLLSKGSKIPNEQSTSTARQPIQYVTTDETYNVPQKNRPQDELYNVPPNHLHQDETYNVPQKHTPTDELFNVPPNHVFEDETYNVPQKFAFPRDETYNIPQKHATYTDETYNVPQKHVPQEDFYNVPPKQVLQEQTYDAPPKKNDNVSSRLPNLTDTTSPRHYKNHTEGAGASAANEKRFNDSPKQSSSSQGVGDETYDLPRPKSSPQGPHRPVVDQTYDAPPSTRVSQRQQSQPDAKRQSLIGQAVLGHNWLRGGDSVYAGDQTYDVPPAVAAQSPPPPKPSRNPKTPPKSSPSPGVASPSVHAAKVVGSPESYVGSGSPQSGGVQRLNPKGSSKPHTYIGYILWFQNVTSN